MSRSGALTKSKMGQIMPVHADPVGFDHAVFKGVDQVTFSYQTDTDAAAAMLPTALSVEENPKISVMFLSYRYTSVGPFREYIQVIHANFQGREIGYVPHIYITNERGMIAGREREGLPKLLADVDFDMAEVNPYGIVTARLSRPAGFALAGGLFRPSQQIGALSEEQPMPLASMGLRVLGSAVPGGDHVVCELVPSTIEFFAGDLWSGEASLSFSGANAMTDVHALPIKSPVQAMAISNGSFRLIRPTETYPVTD